MEAWRHGGMGAWEEGRQKCNQYCFFPSNHENAAMNVRVFQVFTILFYFIISKSVAQSDAKIILIKPTGEQINGFPAMNYVPDSAAICRFVDSAVNETFVGEAVRLYLLAQQYLVNLGEMEAVQPAWLAVTKNQGGFAKQGFYLLENEGIVADKTAAHYIDLTEGSITAPFERLSSLTQLYPHELMHVVFKMLSHSGSVEMTSYNVNMHYFSVITDFNTAFNEGFAEHMENVAVLFEPSEDLKLAKYQSIENIKPKLRQRIAGFKRDYSWPLRLEYYEASMLLWYQQFEDYKRYDHAVNGKGALVNAYPEMKNPRDMITIRNSGIGQVAGHHKNLVQRMASEGFVSTFFTKLAMSELPAFYREESFYRAFRADTTRKFVPEKTFSPFENQFLKYFYVLHHYVDYAHSDRAQLMDFIDGYIAEFPDEAPVLLNIYKDLAGEEYTNTLPPPLWMMVKDHDHPVLVMDPYGAVTVPVYTFDLNAAGIPDLMTITGIDWVTAAKVLDYRDQQGLFRSFKEIRDINGLDKSLRDLLLEHRLDAEYFNSLPEESISITALIIKPLVHLFIKAMLIFIPIGILNILVFYKHKKTGQLILKIVKTLALWLLLLVAGLANVILSGSPALVMAGIAIVYLLIVAVIYRKKKESLTGNLAIALLMNGLVIYSLL